MHIAHLSNLWLLHWNSSLRKEKITLTIATLALSKTCLMDFFSNSLAAMCPWFIRKFCGNFCLHSVNCKYYPLTEPITLFFSLTNTNPLKIFIIIFLLRFHSHLVSRVSACIISSKYWILIFQTVFLIQTFCELRSVRGVKYKKHRKRRYFILFYFIFLVFNCLQRLK